MAPPRRETTRGRDALIVLSVFAAAAVARIRAHGRPNFLAAYDGRAPPGARLREGRHALFPNVKYNDSLELKGKPPLDLLFVSGFKRPASCHCGLYLDPRERCGRETCEKFDFEQKRKGRANCATLAARGECVANSNDMYKECAEVCAAKEPCADIRDHCVFWKNIGECEQNPGYMVGHCPVACGFCDLRAIPRQRCLDLFPDWRGAPPARLVDPAAYAKDVVAHAVGTYGDRAKVLSLDPVVLQVDGFLDAREVAFGKAAAAENVVFHARPSKAGTGWCTGTCRDLAVVRIVGPRVAALALSDSENVTELLHFIRQKPGHQLGPKHDFTAEQVLSPAGPRVFTAKIFLDAAPAGVGGELWFPDLDLAVAPAAGRLVLFSNVLANDLLHADPRARHAHRYLLDHHAASVEVIEAWTHPFDFMTPHRHTCVAPHGRYGDPDGDDAAELNRRSKDLRAKYDRLVASDEDYRAWRDDSRAALLRGALEGTVGADDWHSYLELVSRL